MDKADIKVSIIMPSLNVADYISESVNSASGQTLKEIEIICIDAGSTDGTWEILNEAALRDNRIHVVKSDIKSYGYQVNLGLDMANGEYIAVLETDDYVAQDMYECLYLKAKETDCDYVKCNYKAYVTDKNGNRIFTNRIVSGNEIFYENIFAPVEYPETVIDDWYLWNGLYRADFLRNNRIRFSETPGAAFQDIGFLHSTSINAKKVIYLKESLYMYCVDRDGASSNSGKSLQYISQEYSFLINEKTKEESKAIKVMLYRRMAKIFIHACLDSSNEALGTPQSKEICKWFRMQLKNAENEGLLATGDLPDSLQNGYTYLISKDKDFIEYRKDRFDEFMNFARANKEVIVFGCGIYGRKAYKVLAKHGINTSHYMDNNKELWGKMLDGVSVLSPDVLNELSEEVGFVIANERYANDIINQLLQYKTREKIFVFTPELISM